MVAQSERHDDTAAAAGQLRLSLAAARALHLAAQGLLQPRRHKAGKDDVLACIRQMGVLQIDTIHVVARSPYLVLWSRLGDYPPSWLDALLAEGKLFEYWAHEACFVPVEDYGLYRPRMLAPDGMGWKYPAAWVQENGAAMQALLQHVRSSGPVRSSDFERSDGQSGGWWGWKPEKRALEALFTTGALMIAKRHNFQRVYDLAERVLPDWHDGRLATPAAIERALLLASVKALGLARPEWISDYFRTRQGRLGLGPRLAALVDEGALFTVAVEGWNGPAYVHADHADLAQRAASGALVAGMTLTTILSPFDPVVWDRRRALELFGFDYRLECYTPSEKRRYGYFTLPILRRGALVGRVDAKAHRGDGVFELKALALEPGVRSSARFTRDIAGALQRLANWHGCPHVTVTATSPPDYAATLRAALAPGLPEVCIGCQS